MAQTAQLRRIEHPHNEAQRIFQLQREAYLAHPFPSLDERRTVTHRASRAPAPVTAS